VLVQANLFPLVVTRDDNVTYIEALETADRGDLRPLVDLIARSQRTQFRKATAVSETLLTAEADVQQVLGGLLKAADETHEQKQKALRGVFDRAHVLEDDLVKRLESLTPDITTALLRVHKSSTVLVSRSDELTRHYFRSQIIENAKFHLHYFVDTADYRSWVALNMIWQRRARLVFAFHGIGRPFSGSLVCAPFLEFRDTDEGDAVLASLVPVASEAFVFFYNETEARTLERFKPWRERVLTVALKELSQNL
jgi:hypothetical protein